MGSADEQPHGSAEHSHAPGEGELPAGIETVEHLIEHLAEVVCATTAIVCVGNELCGDDVAGVLVGRQLEGKVPWRVFVTHTVPESFLMRIVEYRPGSVLLIDALDFGAKPGAVELIDADCAGGQGPSTHGPAPLAFLDLLQMMHPCKRAVLGIQPVSGEIGSPVSEAVSRAVDMVVDAFVHLAGGRHPPA